MAWGHAKPDRSGPKRGKGFWGRKAEAKAASKRARRKADGLASEEELAPTEASS